MLPGEEKSCSKLDPSRAKLGPSCELSGPRWAQVMHIKWTKDGFCSKQVHTALLPCHPPLGGPGPSGRNSAVSADNKQTMESSFPNLHMSMQFWKPVLDPSFLWVLQGFVEPFVPCLSLRKHLQTQLQYIVRWLLCFFITQKVTLHCAFSFLATALSLAVLPSRKHLPCDCWRFAALDPHILI